LEVQKVQETRTWFLGIWKTLTSPYPQTFKLIGDSGKNNAKVSIFVLVIAFSIFYVVDPLISGGTRSFIELISTLITGAVFVIIWVAVLHAIYQRVYRREQVVFNQILFVLVCITIVTTSLSYLIWFIPVIGEYSSAITFGYQMILMIIAFKGITKLSWRRSVIANLISLPLAFVVILFLASLLQTVPSVMR
jgi:hypothetical protein